MSISQDDSNREARLKTIFSCLQGKSSLIYYPPRLNFGEKNELLLTRWVRKTKIVSTENDKPVIKDVVILFMAFQCQMFNGKISIFSCDIHKLTKGFSMKLSMEFLCHIILTIHNTLAVYSNHNICVIACCVSVNMLTYHIVDFKIDYLWSKYDVITSNISNYGGKYGLSD